MLENIYERYSQGDKKLAKKIISNTNTSINLQK